MLECPKNVQNIYKFSYKNKMYVADIEQCKVLQIDRITWDILDLCPFSSNEEIIERLSKNYDANEITEALEALGQIEEEGLLFHKEGKQKSIVKENSKRPKIFVAQKVPFQRDITSVAGGAVIAHHHLLFSLAKYADVYVMDSEEKEISEGIYGTPFFLEDKSSFLRFVRENYDGILLKSLSDTEFLSILFYVDVPVVIPIYLTRGRGGSMINSVLLWYSAMRDFDAFTAPTESVKQFYAQLIHDVNCFYTIPCGVDVEHFKPMDKSKAKNEVARLLNDRRIKEKPVVGFFSRFQPEKGAYLYIKIAEMNPQWVFLLLAPDLNVYSLFQLPDNLIYAQRQPRDKLPLFINAFDVHCFPSMVGEETFGLAVLEAMSCAVPPVVPNFDGLPEVVGDAGVVVEASSFKDEIGSFASYVSPSTIQEGIRSLLNNDSERIRLGEKARERALYFTWDESAKRMIALFKELNKKKRIHRKMELSVLFAPHFNHLQRVVEYRSILMNLTENKENPLMFDGYPQTLEEGLALSLLKKHTIHEVEAVLCHIFKDDGQVTDIIKRVEGFRNAIS